MKPQQFLGYQALKRHEQLHHFMIKKIQGSLQCFVATGTCRFIDIDSAVASGAKIIVKPMMLLVAWYRSR